VRYVRAIDPCSFKPNGHEDLIVRAKGRAKNAAPGQSNQKAKWAKGVIQLMKSDLESGRDPEVTEKTSIPKVFELLSDEEDAKSGTDENKIISVKIKKEDVPKCWIEVYLHMPKKTPSKIMKSKQGWKRGSKRGEGNSAEKNSKKSHQEIKGVETLNSISSTCITIDNEFCVIAADDVTSEGRYVQLDLFNGGSKVGSMIDSPKSFEVSVRARKPVSYVVAVDATGIVVDVTSRYSNSVVNTTKVRMQHIEWWEQLVKDSTARERNSRNSSTRSHSFTPLQSMAASTSTERDNITADNSSSSSNARNKRNASTQGTSNVDDVERSNEIFIDVDNRQQDKASRRLAERLKAEQNEFQSSALKEPMPTTLSGFKNHPLYILERDIKVRKCWLLCESI
jgi:Rad4 transglutaminase-like domain/Rad4 beta-hairpin domain 1